MRLRLVAENTHWDFVRWQKPAAVASGGMMIVSLLCFLLLGLNFGIDFRGGTLIRTVSETPVQTALYRGALNDLALGDVIVSQVFDPSFADDEHVAMIRIQAQSTEQSIRPETIDTIKQALRRVDSTVRFAMVESVGPKVSNELIKTAVLAVVLAILAVLVYIWFRFEWQFALAAVAALVHDVVLTIGLFSAVQIKFDLAIIAALLTIVGYSLNDTVVVFDRIRENLSKHRSQSVHSIVNRSLNQVLSRTLMTSLTTLIALVALFVFGGDVIRGFVFAMIVGVIVGTYSSIFIASTGLLALGLTPPLLGDKNPTS